MPLEHKNARPWCQACNLRKATTYCCRHQVNLCTDCASEHDDHKSCYWRAAVPVRLVASKQLELAF
jgi:hypothetical protein